MDPDLPVGRIARAACAIPGGVLVPLVVAPRECALAAGLGRRLVLGAVSAAELWKTPVVHVFSELAELPELVGKLIFSRAALVWTPLSPPAKLPWWTRRVDRIVLQSQAEATLWTAHIAMGRISVAPVGSGRGVALDAIYSEVVAQRRGR